MEKGFSSRTRKKSQSLKQYSFADQKTRVGRRLRFFLWAGGIFVVYLLLTTYFFTFNVMESASMRPGIEAGERFIFLNYHINHAIGDIGVKNAKNPLFPRGAIVLVDREAEKKSPFFLLADNLVRLFSAGRAHFAIGNLKFGAGSDNLFMKRLVALPGDEISMTSYVLRVKPAESAFSLTEFELAARPYSISIPETSALRDESIPFSGNFDAYTLGENECFVLGDDRAGTNDSRTWGPLPLAAIKGRALLRYWPVDKLGAP